jgi:hypothetical protein
MSDEQAVLFDRWCGEPIAWIRYGDPVIGRAWGDGSPIIYTRKLEVPEAINRYGPIAQVLVGVSGGFETITFGETTFASPTIGRDMVRYLREQGLLDDIVVVDDPVTDGYECPKCGVTKGEHCKGTARRHRAREQVAVRADFL